MFGWFGGGGIQLKKFVNANPPHNGTTPMSTERASRYDGRLSASLLELWRTHGLGVYGSSALRLIDPEPWQPILDRWVAVKRLPTTKRKWDRIPIALSPFGDLVFSAKVDEDDGGVCAVNATFSTMRIFGKNADEFFNGFMTRRKEREDFIEPGWLEDARERCGELEAHEVYQVDRLLLEMHMLKSVKRDAMEMHHELCDALAAKQAAAEQKAQT